jgi:hypothetical protein
MQFNEYESFPYDGLVEDPEPECICLEYLGAPKPVLCRACGRWTDELDVELQDELDKAIEPSTVEAMLTNTNRVMSAVYQAMEKSNG